MSGGRYYKHSDRTIRSGCKKCGSTSLYWAHDIHQGTGATKCTKCGVTGNFVLVELDGETRHECINREGARDLLEGSRELMAKLVDQPQRWVRLDEPPLLITPEPVKEALAVPVSTDPAFEAFQTLVASIRPTLDKDEIVNLIKAEFEGYTFPTRTVLEKATGELIEIEGATHHKVADVLVDLTAGEHVMMVGPAGTGKSTIASQCAAALGFEYYSISLSPMTPSSQILGYMQAAGEYVRSLYREAYENGGVFHFDEIDNAHPSVLAVINASLANGHMAFPDKMVARHANFRCVASANTYGKGADRAYVGRQAIDAATLDRFTIESIEIDEALETQLCTNTGANATTVTKVLTTVRKYRANAAKKGMLVVVSPRASVGMCRLLAAGKSWDAAIEVRVRRGLSDADWAKLTS